MNIHSFGAIFCCRYNAIKINVFNVCFKELCKFSNDLSAQLFCSHLSRCTSYICRTRCIGTWIKRYNICVGFNNSHIFHRTTDYFTCHLRQYSIRAHAHIGRTSVQCVVTIIAKANFYRCYVDISNARTLQC